MERGKFIVIEGIDGSGKTAQFELLKKRLKKEKLDVKVADFPRYYQSVWGKMVGKFLKGEYGNFDTTSPYFVALPYMIDEYTWGRDIGEKILQNGGVILSNRYFTSNVHQIAKMKGLKKEEYKKWLWDSGYNKLGILKPDLVLFLDVSADVAFKMNKQKKNRKYLDGKSEDEAEKRFYHQNYAYKEYLKTTSQFRYWRRIKCMSGGKIDAVETIHDRIWGLVKKSL